MTDVPVLTNGRYRVALSAAGSGSSTLGDIQLTRWSGDATTDADGFFAYVRDMDSLQYWSAGYQPVPSPCEGYRAWVGDDSFRLLRTQQGITVQTEIVVDGVRDQEWRRFTITNQGNTARRLELTTCAEVALNSAAADGAHPAFSKLFVQTERVTERGALLAHRRPRSPEEVPLYLGHALIVPGAIAGATLTSESDRARFVGRGRSLANPIALEGTSVLSGTVGNVLDPVLVLRHEFTLAPGAVFACDAVLAAGHDRDAVVAALVASAAPGAGDAVFAAIGALTELDAPQPLGPRDYQPAAGVAAIADASEPLQFDNGYGGFSADGAEYVIRLDRTVGGLHRPPMAWTNVVANEAAGFVASESGLGFTWAGNSRENRITPWFNDPLSDPTGEAIYLRDEKLGIYWSPTPAPVPGSGSYETRHGFGYTSWRHASVGLDQEVVAFMAQEAPVKIVRLRVTNRGLSPRDISCFYYAEWVLGGLRATAVPTVVTESHHDGRVILATNPANLDFAEHAAFATVVGPAALAREFTTDRLAFLGQYHGAATPSAVTASAPLDGRTGAGLDPCAAFRLATTIEPGATAEWVILLGEEIDRASALKRCARFATTEAVEEELGRVIGFWRGLLTSVRVATPSPAIDLMLNGWLGYQNLSCRIWARSAMYQSGGAFGYRDQLQDASAMVYQWPALTRRQIVLHASNQFVEGDVLHWWHPPVGRGIRTRFSDDLLWLPLLTQYYVDTTGDASVFDAIAPFLTARELEPGEDEAFLEPTASGTSGDVYEHCCRALDRSLAGGAHDLPLMGTGDWNDGMNRVGRLGRGESVWLGFFLYLILDRFIPTCVARGDTARAARYRERMQTLHAALNMSGWDGEWYRRAYYDDGTPIGSATSDECRIDAIAQAWSVMSGVAPGDRAAMALNAMEQQLVDEPAGLIRLLTPPFDRTPHDPGYIKGYLPGVRENGGQYTHAALWAVRALAEAGRGERAAELLEMLSPATRGGSPEAIEIYKADPYVIAADVYGVQPHTGRGGWTWYTGSAGWMFRVALESVLGVTIASGRTLVIRPCIPSDWPGFSLWYRLPDGKTRYEIVVQRTDGPSSVHADGLNTSIEDGAVRVELVSDDGTHRVEIALGQDVGPSYRPSTPPLDRMTSA